MKRSSIQVVGRQYEPSHFLRCPICAAAGCDYGAIIGIAMRKQAELAETLKKMHK